ncbi:MAG TPA: alpha/beta fold hydrolase [Noviherbaspirillum sp.]|jgi:triacylglycerol esterase/lipase EstA (alpha/beta hydrolase family)|uniref:esterase/lipase family protein n=1 Tax=Noviherbaspirillum sp. TaxID=1926288 RepID=UPI002DDD39E0|nr:alpha/beta fold hydrolase [Noviherbaspirillum sp.]HEV2612420.1 alpha/beta fold hydrolase [Noviherbaspirillum sp.]
MIVRITRTLLLLQLLVAATISAAVAKVLGVNAWIAVIWGIGAVVLLRLLINANNFYLSWRYRSETPAAYRLNVLQALKLFIGEFSASMISSSWTMPFYAFDKRIARRPATLPVLLVHGYGCNSGYWHSMSKAMTRANVSHYAIDMEPVIGSIDAYASVIHRAVENICSETGCEKIVIVAHSMGGLASRVYLRDHGDRRVAKIITLGTPHRGTGLANFGVGLNCEQMRWTEDGLEGVCSEWLQALAASEDVDSYRAFVSIFSHHDNIIAPQMSSRLPGAVNIELGGVGHVALAMHPEVQSIVIEEVLKVPR